MEARTRSFAMKMKRIAILALAVTGMAIVLSPNQLAAQDPMQNPPSPTNQNQQTGAPGYSNQTGASGTQATTMRDTLGAPGETGQQMQDKIFVQKATEGGIAQVQLGKLAVQKGSPEVKEFAQKMIDDHTATNKEMANVADSIGTMLPRKMNKDDQAEYNKLNGLSGDEFDKEYILYVAKGHREDMREFRMEVSVAADPGLQAEVAKAATMTREHLMMLTKLAKDKGVELPARPSRPATPPAGE
jgi:putative membrane protein